MTNAMTMAVAASVRMHMLVHMVRTHLAAAAVRQNTRHMLKLDRGVVDLEFIAQRHLDLFENQRAF